jgi:hypothetical protein
MGVIFWIVLLLLVLGSIPTWPRGRRWGYRPSGALGAVLLVAGVLVLVLMGRF